MLRTHLYAGVPERDRFDVARILPVGGWVDPGEQLLIVLNEFECVLIDQGQGLLLRERGRVRVFNYDKAETRER